MFVLECRRVGSAHCKRLRDFYPGLPVPSDPTSPPDAGDRSTPAIDQLTEPSEQAR